MHSKLLILLFAIAVSVYPTGEPLAQESHQDDSMGRRIEEKYGTILYRTRWKVKIIKVCWESLSTSTQDQRALVEAAATNSWQHYSGIRFDFQRNQRCQPNQPGVHIQVGSVRPRTEKLGKLLDGRENGMKLNFNPDTFARIECKGRESVCITAMAVHEFGHALGFTHEQNRPDAPPECRDEHASGSVGDYLVTKYDPKSIMNYCEPLWEGNGELSPLDQEAVRAVYP
ncbi:M12 family metallopeptidase [Rhizobium binae]|uniref:M12 family metallopeptidase n=1 Tax=Rhizobium binae TaxID=1138190 RepID=UPI001C83FEC2|nr:M12 family metallopeptidase [Rhizobium binae]MBX4962150.1 ATPase [Rhizobium binae]